MKLGCFALGILCIAFYSLYYRIRQMETSVPENLLTQMEGQIWSSDAKVDETIRMFKIQDNPKRLSKLKSRLEEHLELTPPLTDLRSFKYGFNSDYLTSQVVKHWAKVYNWTERMQKMNAFSQFQTKIMGLQIHFVRIKPKNVNKKRVIPLLMLHGWPGSFIELCEAGQLLASDDTNSEYALEVIIPSLPGYGFSEGATKSGLSASHIAPIMAALMRRLGYDRWLVQGGDWGAIIATDISILYPKSVIGLHSNMCFHNGVGGYFTLIINGIWRNVRNYFGLSNPPQMPSSMFPLGEKFLYLLEEFGYLHIQATKPDTVGVALSDSPVGLAAYILEKFSTWTNREWRNLPDGGLTNWDMDKLLDNVMIYWMTNSIITSSRLYKETFTTDYLSGFAVMVPSVCAQYPNELSTLPEDVLHLKYHRLLDITYPSQGGHFAAFERPFEFAKDVKRAVNIIMKQN